jgi:hypothetical protein
VPDGVRVSARHAMFAQALWRNATSQMGREVLPFDECPPEIAQRCNVLCSRHQVCSLDERSVMGRCNLPCYCKRLSAEDRRTFDRWLQANAIFGSIFAAVLIAMAFAGSRSIALRDATVASGTTTAFEVGASEQHRTRTEVVTTHGPPIRSDNKTKRGAPIRSGSPGNADLQPPGQTPLGTSPM